MKTLAVVSGGLDSVTLAYLLHEKKELGGIVSFDYGQRHKKELEFAVLAAQRMKVPHHLIDISSITAHLKGSALTDNVEVPEGHYAAESMKQTIVPNRNAIMLAIAYGIAPAHGYDAVALAVHGGDHFIYPDCRPEFAELFDRMEQKAMEGFADIKLLTPFIDKTKTDIAAEAARLWIPFNETWSCYKGGTFHCGRCGTCVERREAFALANVKDPTIYEDPDFWIEECKKKAAST